MTVTNINKTIHPSVRKQLKAAGPPPVVRKAYVITDETIKGQQLGGVKIKWGGEGNKVGTVLMTDQQARYFLDHGKIKLA